MAATPMAFPVLPVILVVASPLTGAFRDQAGP